MSEFSTTQLTEIHQVIMQHLSNLEIKVTDGEPAKHFPDDCVFYEGHCFKMFPEAKTWPEAKTACEDIGGHLATSTSAEKNAFLTSLADGKSVWLGGTDEAGEGNWKWINGEDWNYSNWNTGEPNNAGGREHYLELNYGIVGNWNDLPDTSTLGYICEWDGKFQLHLNPEDIPHEKLGGLLGGGEYGYYHLSAEDLQKLGLSVTPKDPDPEPALEPEPEPEPDGEAGDVYAIGYYAQTWRGDNEVDDYGFSRLHIPKAKRLSSLSNMIWAAQADNGKWYGCHRTTQIYDTFGIRGFSPKIPTEIPIDDITEIASGANGGGSYCCFLDSNNNCRAYRIGQTGSAPIIFPNVKTLSSDNSYALSIITKDGDRIHIKASNGVVAQGSIGLQVSSIKTVGYEALPLILTTEGDLYQIPNAISEPAQKVEFPYGKIREIYSTQYWGSGSLIRALFVLTENNDLYAKGQNTNYSLGLPNASQYTTFTKVGNYKVKRICSQNYSTFMLLEDGTLWHTGKISANYRITDTHQGFEQIFPELKFKDIAYICDTLVVIRDEPKEATDWTRTALPQNMPLYRFMANEGRIYYGPLVSVNKYKNQSGLVVHWQGNANYSYSWVTDDLAQWTNYFGRISQTSLTYSDYLYIDWNKETTKLNAARMFYSMVSPDKVLRYRFADTTATNKSIAINGGGVVAGSYSPELRIALFVSAEGLITRLKDTSIKINTVTPTKIVETSPDCGVNPNFGCLKWSPAVNVFCVTGTDGVATSPTGEAGSWIKYLGTPENLNGLEYREDINGGSFIAWSAVDKHIYTSKQGSFWLQYSSNPIPLDNIASVAYSLETGYYCAVPKQGNKAYFSKDLAEWSSTKISIKENLKINGVVWMSSVKKFVLVPAEGYILYTYEPR